MKKFFPLLLFALLISNLSFGQLSKTEKQKLKNELKSYLSDLEGYKAKKDDIQITLDSNESQIKSLKDELAYTIINQSEMANKVAAYENEVKKLRAENEELKNWNDSSAAIVNESATSTATGPTGANEKGTVFKIQIGNYKVFNATKHFEKPRYISYETDGETNRYIIGSFSDRKAAFGFLEDIKKMGISDAFVAKYINGKRVEGWGK
jgi:hypothetical protein